MTIDEYEIGNRIHIDDGSRGTIAYIGQLDNRDGIWFGIDWDDAKRGRHNGTVDGRQYFIAKYPSSGSFIRYNKICAPIDFMQALHQRYGNATATIATEHFGNKCVEFVAFDRIERVQRDYFRLKVIVLEDMFISKAFDIDSNINFPLCVELNLTNNLIDSWSVVLDIITRLPNIRTLNLSKNIIRIPSDLSIFESNNEWLTAARRIRTLVLSECQMQWLNVSIAIGIFINVEELVLSKNAICNIDPIDNTCLRLLSSIDLESNPIIEFNHLLQFATLPRLIYMNINNCQLRSIQFGDNAGFSTLVTLHISRNLFSDWNDIQQLNRLASLRILFIGDNSICTDRLDCRSQIISRLPRLTQLDRVVITSRDRRSAELDYLRRYGTEWQQSRVDNNTSNQFDQYHQEFARLITKYGAPDLNIDSHHRDERIRSRLIQLNIVFPLTSIESTTISIPSSMNVGKIKTLIARHCSRCNNSNARSLRLSTGDLGIALDNDLRELSYYSIESGDTIHVTFVE